MAKKKSNIILPSNNLFAIPAVEQPKPLIYNTSLNVITKTWSGADDNSVIYTVSLNSTLYICGISMYGAIPAQYYLTTAEGTIIINLGAAPNWGSLGGGYPIMRVKAGDRVIIGGGGAGGNGGCFWGFEEPEKI